MEEIFFIIVGVLFLIGWLWLDSHNQRYKVKILSQELDILRPLNLMRKSLDAEQKSFNENKFEFDIYKRRQEEKLANDKQALELYFRTEKDNFSRLVKERTQGFPWLADAYADYLYLKDKERALYLEQKNRPAEKAADQIREIAKEKRALERELRVYKYKAKYYESLVPLLADLEDGNEDELINISGEFDPLKAFLSDDEYNNLTSVERNQLALDRYWRKRKSKWQLGRDYERYIGYLFESRGYKVEYRGIIDGFSDLGRDLIVNKGFEVSIVQCKYWAKEKTIHEKHIFQLHGTTTLYKIDSGVNAKAVFYTSTTLSEKAKSVAKILGVEVYENLHLERYPCIKCNITRQNGKIYHLPFDQQYDNVVIESKNGECYVQTVLEAEKLGFRRAFKWQGEKN